MTKAIKQFAAAALLLTFIVCAPASLSAQKRSVNAAAAAPGFGNTSGVTAKQLKDYLTFIASDELEGRDTPSRGLDIAAMYIAQHLASWGIKPAGDDGSYFQKVPLRSSKVIANESYVNYGGQSWEYGKDFLAGQIASGNVRDAQMVFAGYGWVVKSKNINSYDGIDVKDKVVVVVNALPKGVTNADLKGPNGGEWSSPGEYARAHGAKAVLSIASFGTLSNWDAQRWTQSERGIVAFGPAPQAVPIPSLTIGPRLAAVLMFGEKLSAGAAFTKSYTGENLDPFEFKTDKRIDLSMSVRTTDTHTQNVVGILEGSDPTLKSEYVAIGAHYDHVGTNPFTPNPDKIWNGADDDGSGTVSVLSIAEAFAKGSARPKRSMLFIWHAGEEKGLWGSEYFTDHPTVPITSVITELNIDMIGRFQKPGDENHPINKELPKPGEVFTIGSRMMSTDLGNISDEVNKAFMNLNYNTKYDDPNDPNRYFYRSDHFNYAKHGVPIIFFMDGTHEDYHQPSDSVEKINFDQMEKVARTIMATGWELANRPARPVVDKPLPASVTGN